MTTMDVDACVVDTNVLVYSTVLGNPWYRQARQWLSMLQEAGVKLCVTTQILREYMVVLTRGIVFEKTFSVAQVLAQVEAVLPVFAVLDEPVETAALLRELMCRCQVRGKHIHDANVVAVMLTHGIHRLAIYNRADFASFDQIALEEEPALDAQI